MNLNLSNSLKSKIGLALRATQLVFTIISLGVSAGLVHKIKGFDLSDSRSNYAVACSVIVFVYLVATTVLSSMVFSLVTFIGDTISSIFWLASFASVADDWSNTSCDHYFGNLEDACRLADTTIAFGVLNWLLFAASAILLSIFTIYPAGLPGGFFARTGRDNIFAEGSTDSVLTTKEHVQSEDLEEAGPSAVESTSAAPVSGDAASNESEKIQV